MTVAILWIAASLGACGGTDRPSSRDQEAAQTPPSEIQTGVTPGSSVAIDFASTPDPLEAGDNTIAVTVKQPDGSPVTDASVTAVFSMPAMPAMNMPAMRSESALTHVGNGRYQGTGELSMSGTWNVAIMAFRESAPLGTRRFSIVAK